jgi:hypothetical protein
MAKELLHMAIDADVSDAVKINAIRDTLDRAGLKPGVEVEIITKLIDQTMDGLAGIAGGSREAFRRGIAGENHSDSGQYPRPRRSAPSRSTRKWSKTSTCTAPLKNQQGHIYTTTADPD